MVRSRKPVIFIVDDDSDLLKVVEAVLGGPYQVKCFTNAREALLAIETGEPDLIVLDLMMPGTDGFEVCRHVRRRSHVPIIVLSAQDRPRDKARALNLGADDFVTKPFHVEELLARVRAVLRRVTKNEQTSPPVLRAGELTIDFEQRQVFLSGSQVKLTPTEFNLLRELASEPGKLMTHVLLLQRVWGPEYRDELDYLRVFIRRLRRKIEPYPNQPQFIVTESRAGYRFRIPQPTETPS